LSIHERGRMNGSELARYWEVIDVRKIILKSNDSLNSTSVLVLITVSYSNNETLLHSSSRRGFGRLSCDHIATRLGFCGSSLRRRRVTRNTIKIDFSFPEAPATEINFNDPLIFHAMKAAIAILNKLSWERFRLSEILASRAAQLPIWWYEGHPQINTNHVS
jgi:hypothetical protein